jgi:hypothetical protein
MNVVVEREFGVVLPPRASEISQRLDDSLAETTELPDKPFSDETPDAPEIERLGEGQDRTDIGVIGRRLHPVPGGVDAR